MTYRPVFRMRLENNLYKLVTKTKTYDKHYDIRSVLMTNRDYLISMAGYNCINNTFEVAATRSFNKYNKEEVSIMSNEQKEIRETVTRAILLDIDVEDIGNMFDEFKDEDLIATIVNESVELDYKETDILVNVIIRRD